MGLPVAPEESIIRPGPYTLWVTLQYTFENIVPANMIVGQCNQCDFRHRIFRIRTHWSFSGIILISSALSFFSASESASWIRKLTQRQVLILLRTASKPYATPNSLGADRLSYWARFFCSIVRNNLKKGRTSPIAVKVEQRSAPALEAFTSTYLPSHSFLDTVRL